MPVLICKERISRPIAGFAASAITVAAVRTTTTARPVAIQDDTRGAKDLLKDNDTMHSAVQCYSILSKLQRKAKKEIKSSPADDPKHRVIYQEDYQAPTIT